MNNLIYKGYIMLSTVKSVIFFLLFSFTLLESQDISGQVVGIVDGDTIKVLEYQEDGSKKLYKIRLSNIDAPEKRQDFGKKSKKILSDLLFKKWIYVDTSTKDRYGRYIGTVYVDSININHEMVKRGLAWVYRKYCNDDYYYILEKEARDNYLGIWSQPDPIAPWDFRHKKGKIYTKPYQQNTYKSSVSKQSIIIRKNENSQFSCEGKRYCKHMNSCEEAYFYLNSCGLSRLDRDRDGVPCEAICGHH